MERNTALFAKEKLRQNKLENEVDIEQLTEFKNQFNNMDSIDIESWIDRQIMFKTSRLVGIGNEMYVINKALEK